MNTTVKYVVRGEEFYLPSHKEARKLFEEGKVTLYSVNLDEVTEITSKEQFDDLFFQHPVFCVKVDEYNSIYNKQDFSVKYARKLMDEISKEAEYAVEETSDLIQYIEGLSVHEDNDEYSKEGNEDVEDKHEVYFLKETLKCLKGMNKLLGGLPYKRLKP